MRLIIPFFMQSEMITLFLLKYLYSFVYDTLQRFVE